MGKKNIAIEQDVYDELLGLKHGNDTFTNVIRRLLDLPRDEMKE